MAGLACAGSHELSSMILNPAMRDLEMACNIFWSNGLLRLRIPVPSHAARRPGLPMHSRSYFQSFLVGDRACIYFRYYPWRSAHPARNSPQLLGSSVRSVRITYFSDQCWEERAETEAKGLACTRHVLPPSSPITSLSSLVVQSCLLGGVCSANSCLGSW